ncbi:hypothetical protein D3C79_883020 [compost metagenome]
MNQITANSSTAENFIRSAKPPTMRPQVMAAKAPWNTTKMNSLIPTPLLKVAPIDSGVTPISSTLSKDP